MAIRSEVRPLLKGAGFVRSTARTFWRYHADRVDVVNFQSFNSYTADGLGATTYSYAVNLGCFLRYIPDQYPNAKNSKLLVGENPQPEEYQCHMRGALSRSYAEKRISSSKIWYIDPKGVNLQKALHDTRMVLNRDAFPWYEQFVSPRAVYDILATREELMDSLWGFGRPKSPIRLYFLGYAAKAAGLLDAAAANLTEAASTKNFESIKEKILSDARRVA